LQASKLEKIEKVGIVLRPSTPDIKELFLKVKRLFEAKGVEVYIDSMSAAMIDVLGSDFDYMCQSVDFIVSIGGDGTLISVARRSFGFDKPVLGINIGKLGFLTDINPEDIEEFIQKLFDRKYVVDNRLVLSGELVGDEDTKKFVGLNDFVITRKNISHTIKLRAKIGKKVINTYRGDGLIISTPTGSTAYNLSSGGPMLYPMTPAFIVNPICPHSLTQRPIILPVNFDVEVEIEDDYCMAMLDGQDSFTLNAGDRVKIMMAQVGAKILHHKNRNFFKVISDKLNWGD